MVSLIKTFGKGILYVIGLPFFLLALLLFAVIGIFLFLFQIIRSVIYFFTGQKFFPELEEDKQLRLLKEKIAGPNEEDEEVEEQSSSLNEDSIIMPLPPVIQKQPEEVEEQKPSIEEACFVEPEDLTQEKDNNEEDEDVLMESLVREQLAQEEAKTEEPFVEIKEETLETSEPKEEETVVEEELEEYVPKSSSYFEDIDEEDTNDNGVDIDYDVR